MRFTEPPDWLAVPSRNQIDRAARFEGMDGLDDYEHDLVLDLVCREVGFPLKPFDYQAVDDGAAAYAQRLLTVRYPPHEIEDDEDRQDALERLSSEFYHVATATYGLLQNPPLNLVPGRNPLQRAVRLIKLLRLLQMARIELFWKGGGLLTVLCSALRRAQAMDADMQLQLSPFTSDDIVSSDEQSVDTQQLAAEFMVMDLRVDEMLRICRALDEVSALNNSHALQVHPDDDGEDIWLRPIDRLGELMQVRQTDLALPQPLMLYRAVTQQLQVRERITRREPKQLIYMLVDWTASMRSAAYEYDVPDDGLPIARAAGLVLNRLKAVVDGDAEVFLRFFDTDVSEQEYHADSPASARALIEMVTNPAFYAGGGTRFQQPLAVTAQRVKELVAAGKLRDPEIVMVTDGRQAPIPHLSVLGGAKLHAVQVGANMVPKLTELALASGGVSIDATGSKLVVQ